LGPLRSQREPIPIDARAADHLRYIRETMENAAEFTAVPGWGGVAMGVTALVAAFAASRQTTPRAWLAVWLIEAFVAVALAAPAFWLRQCWEMRLWRRALGWCRLVLAGGSRGIMEASRKSNG